MIRRALFAVVLLACGMAGAAKAQFDQMVIWYDRTDGSAYLKNNADWSIRMDGYAIGSDFDDLLTGDFDGSKGWKALEDYRTIHVSELDDLEAALGPGASTFGSANPSPDNLLELTLSPLGAEFSPGESWFIGKPFTTVPIDDAGNSKPGYSFLWKGTDLDVGGVSRIVGAPVPEPSTLVLATLAGLGLVAVRSRGLRSGARRPQ